MLRTVLNIKVELNLIELNILYSILQIISYIRQKKNKESHFLLTDLI